MADTGGDYAFPHSGAEERHRLDLFAARLPARPADPDFLSCGFAFIGAWGRSPAPPA